MPLDKVASYCVFRSHPCNKHMHVPVCLTMQEYSAVYVASQRLEQLLELMANDGDTRPLVVTSRDRLDIVMGLLASQVRKDRPSTACWQQKS